MTTDSRFATLAIGEARLQVPLGELFQAWLETSLRKPVAASAATSPPALGAEWPEQEGVYAGLVRGENGARDYHLIVPSDTRMQLEAATWPFAVEWAAKLGDGLSLPTRRELRVLWANVSELFASEWHWSSEQYAGYDSFAWAQLFGDGSQDYCHKGGELRARPVRRLTI